MKNNVKELTTRKFLAHAIAKLDDETVFNLVRRGLEEGIDSYKIIEEATAGMVKVGELYNSGKYFLADLIVAAELFQDMLSLVLKGEEAKPAAKWPPIIFGTVEEDIHDIGKNITIGFLKGKGFPVADMGVNVPADQFVEAVKKHESSILCLSGLITTAYDSMKKTVRLLEEEGLKSEVTVIIGGLVNEPVRKHTGADYWVTDCGVGCDLIESILQLNKQKNALSS